MAIRSNLKVCLINAVSITALSITSAFAQGDTYTFNVNSQPLAEALSEFAEQADITVFSSARATSGHMARPLSGNYSVPQALSIMLQGSGLVASTNSDGVVYVSAAEASDLSEAEEETAFSGNTSVPETDVIVVTGIAGQNRAAIGAKLNSDAVAEFIFSDEIGQYPDYNISDAIRRVSGVNTIFDEDEGRYVAIRGMSADFTYTSIDGASIAALDLGGDLGGGRRVLLEAVPSFAVASSEIYKTTSAERDGQGIGGQVNLVTRSAYDRDEMYFTARGLLGYYDSDDYPTSDNGPSIRADLAYTNQFGKNDEFGIVFSASYMLKDRDQERIAPGNYTYRDANGDPVSDPAVDDWAFASPRFIVQRAYKNEIQRYGGLLKFEHKPNDRFYHSISGQYYTQVDDEERTDTFPNAGSVTSYDGSTYTLEGADITSRVQFWDIDKWVSNVLYNAAYEPNDDMTFDFKVNYSQSGWEEYVPRTAFFTRRTVDYIATPGTSDRAVSFVITDPDSDYFNPLAFDRFDGRLRIDEEKEEVWQARGDFGYNAAKDDSGVGFRTGFNLRRTERDFDRDQFRYRQGSDFNLTLADYLVDSSFIPVQGSYPIYIHDAPTLFAEVLAETDGDAGQFRLDENWSAPRSRASDFLVREDVFAAYAQVIHEGDRHRLEAGLRFEYTDVFAEANQDTTTVELVGTDEVVTTVEGMIERNGQYTNVLPSFAFMYDLRDGLRLRTAFSESIGRPSYRSISGTVDERFDEIQGITTITEGNPDLDPRISRNYDVELVWYTDDNDTLISLGAFYKDIRNDIFVRTSTLNDGALVITRPENVETSSVKGIELSVIDNNLDFLPGRLSNFGVNFNASWIDAEINVDDETKFGYRLEQPEFLFNSTLFYQEGPFEGRITYNHTGEQPRAIDVGVPYLSRWEQTFEQLDANIDYQINDQWELRVQGRNLTNEKRIINEGPGRSQVWDISEFGPQYWVGVTYRR